MAYFFMSNMPNFVSPSEWLTFRVNCAFIFLETNAMPAMLSFFFCVACSRLCLFFLAPHTFQSYLTIVIANNGLGYLPLHFVKMSMPTFKSFLADLLIFHRARVPYPPLVTQGLLISHSFFCGSIGIYGFQW